MLLGKLGAEETPSQIFIIPRDFLMNQKIQNRINVLNSKRSWHKHH